MVNRFLMRCSKGFRLFAYSTALIIGLRAPLPSELFGSLALMWALLTIPVAVIGSWWNSFWKGIAAAGIPLLIVSLLDPARLFVPFLGIFAIAAVLSVLSVLLALAMGQGTSEQHDSKPIDDAVVSVAPKLSNADATAAEVLARFGLNKQGVQ